MPRPVILHPDLDNHFVRRGAIPPACCSSHEKQPAGSWRVFSCCHRSALDRPALPRFRGSPDHHRHPRTEYITAVSRPTIHVHPPRSPSPHLVKAPRTRVPPPPPPRGAPSPPTLRCELPRIGEKRRIEAPACHLGSTAARPGAKGRPNRARRPSQPWNPGNHSAPALLLNQRTTPTRATTKPTRTRLQAVPQPCMSRPLAGPVL